MAMDLSLHNVNENNNNDPKVVDLSIPKKYIENDNDSSKTLHSDDKKYLTFDIYIANLTIKRCRGSHYLVISIYLCNF